ncbi:sirohydrochlorin chelatase [Tsukamurella sp. 8F]|uniref:sirohydrochlorin chelatase n=1 Tax=unclassified Tsukamurella TaxID=2633480 RepID=UPI0023B937FE|nr:MULTISPECIES: sirohydrochlorin chelatase [unclassified Tsukamurella]MDF0528832.1 sirohydrochlorin chelatase [Tsukamurella sp. 8J]MDF0586667.1 sirohydrochlorin chelatase [Tsukamurella sp. 8F]
MTTLLVAHGTRNPHGVKMIGDLAAAMSDSLDEAVRVAFVDVLGPSPDEVLRSLASSATVLVPAFLSSGYHVRVDVPAHVAASGHREVTVTDALGPSPELARAMLDRLLESGWCPGDHVILAAAGTSDTHAQGEVRAAAAMLSALVGHRVSIAFAAPCRDGSGYPSVSDTVARARCAGARRVAVASYLLAEGLFQGRLEESGADVVSGPLGLHPAVVRLACRRRRHALLLAPAAA